MTDIATFLMYNEGAEEAFKFYTDTIKGSKLISPLMFSIGDQKFYAYNGGPHFKFTEAISFSVDCKTQEEVDDFWEKLSEGGEQGQCGWLKDKYGLSWQINPTVLSQMLGDPDPEKSKRVMEAMLRMKKIDIKRLKQAYEQK